MRIAVIHGNDGSDVRVGKTCRSLSRLGFDTHFIGWDRRPATAKTVDLGGAQRHVIERATPYGRGTAGSYAAFLAFVTDRLRRIRPDVACAVNEELACALLPFRGSLYRRLVCDIFDSLAPRVSGRPALIRLPLQAAAGLALLGADRLIATDDVRQAMLGRFARKSIVVENVPEDPGDELARTLPTGPVRIWAGGSLDSRRGLGQLLEAIEGMPAVQVLSAGWPYDEFAENTFLKHSRVEYHGIVTARRALELAASCDAVFSYYAPVNSYMVNASPNKVYDALSIGRPVIINSEVQLSGWVQQAAIGMTAPYEDVVALRRIIESLPERRGDLPAYAIRARDLFRQRYHWGLMESRLQSLYTEVGGASRR